MTTDPTATGPSGTAAPGPDTPAAGAVERACQDFLDLTYLAFPTTATAYGEHAFDDQLDDLTEANLDGYAADVRRLRERLLLLDPAEPEAAADRDGLAAELARVGFEHEVERPWRRNPLTAATAVPGAVLDLVARDFAPREERLGNLADRLTAVPRFLNQATALLDEPCPAAWRSMAVGAARHGAAFLDGEIAGAGAGAAVEGRLAEAAATAAGALRDYAGWLEEVHTARFPDDAPFAIGEAAQTRRLREVHCLDTTPARLAALGEAQVETITAALARQAGRMGGDDWVATLDAVKADHPTDEGLLPAYAAELGRLESFVFEHDLFTDPRAKAEVVATPGFLRGFMGFAAYYAAGPFDARQHGYFYVTPPPEPAGLRDHAFAAIPAIAAHEGWPGHHLQFTSVNRLRSVTRRAIRSTGMIEGWGLYVEDLMHRAGYYRDEARLVQLSMRLLRAVRIVLDMGLQAGELTVDEAVDRLMTTARVSAPTARSEVARYTMTPTQPFSYLTGALELERLRAESETRQGAAFSLRDFHDRVLAYGHMPPPLVRRAMAAGDEAELGLE